MLSYKNIFTNKKRILFVTAHPDDVDAYFGGTIKLLRNDKKEVFVVVVTNGARGSRQNHISEAELGFKREEEQRRALDVLGVNDEFYIPFNNLDGEVENSFKLVEEIVGVIRKIKPDIVVTFQPEGYYYPFGSRGEHYIHHRDHRNTGAATVDAVYPFSRDISFFKDQIANGHSSHTVKELLLTGDRDANAFIDITQVIEDKKKALLEHKSQFDEDTVERILDASRKDNQYFEKGTYIKLAW
jgi:LmbE family N-acetylglucosaminyl deacetylase